MNKLIVLAIIVIGLFFFKDYLLTPEVAQVIPDSTCTKESDCARYNFKEDTGERYCWKDNVYGSDVETLHTCGNQIGRDERCYIKQQVQHNDVLREVCTYGCSNGKCNPPPTGEVTTTTTTLPVTPTVTTTTTTIPSVSEDPIGFISSLAVRAGNVLEKVLDLFLGWLKNVKL